jgi:flagellar FliJ protein
MKRFRFPLRPVAVLRAHQEMLAREAFASAAQARARAEQELNACHERLQLIEAAVTAGRSGTFSAADEINALAAYRAECVNEVAAQKVVAEAQQVVEQRRVDYTDAHRRVEVIRRLEDKARAQHRYETMHEEQAEFDDFASQRFSARHRRTS